MVGLGFVDSSVTGGFHSSNIACHSSEKGELSSSLSCVCLSVMRRLVFSGGLFDSLLFVFFFGMWSLELKSILRLVMDSSFLHDWSQPQSGDAHFTDLAAMLVLLASGLFCIAV